MIITITTDASYSSEYKAGAYAFQINSDNGALQHSGVFEQQLECSAEAEINAIRKAVYVVQAMNLQKGDRFIINTDCFPAIDAMKWLFTTKGNKRLKAHAKELHHALTKTPGVKYELRHVKAHSEVKDKRSHVNRWCDEEARKQLSIHLKQIKDERNK